MGPDTSAVVYEFQDGWTVRRIANIVDQHREGVLLRNCLAGRFKMDENCWSLRDPDNLPHLCFACWRVEEGDDLSEVPFDMPKMTFLRGEQFLLMVDTPNGLKEVRRAQLLEFADVDLDLGDVEWFPTTPREQLRACARGHNVAFGL